MLMDKVSFPEKEWPAKNCSKVILIACDAVSLLWNGIGLAWDWRLRWQQNK